MNPAPDSASFTPLDALLLDQASELLLLLEPETLQIRTANRQARERLGYAVENLIGMPITDIVCALTDVFYWEEVRAGNLQEIEAAEGLFQCADGSLIAVEETIRHVQCDGRDWLLIRARENAREVEEKDLLALTTSQLRATLEATADGILVRDQDGRIVNMNHRFALLWGLPDDLLMRAEDAEVLDAMASRSIHPAAFRSRLAAISLLSDEETLDIVELANGQVLEQHTHPHTLEERIIGRVYTYADISHRLRAESDRRVAAIAFESQEAICITDADQIILKVNQAFTRITGYSAAEAIGNTPGHLLKSGRHDDLFYRDMWVSLKRDRHWQGEIWNRRKNGAVFPEWLTITAVTDDQGQISHYVAAFSDTSRNKKAEAEIHNLAFYDPLTELPNRRLFQDRLGHALAASARSQKHGAILLLDLDHFKELNDTKGHGIGDLLLVDIAQRLRASVREEDTVARLGGDEFVVILAELALDARQAMSHAEAVAEKMRASIAQPIQLQDHLYHGSPSVGICLFHGHEISVEELMKRADTAMYQAKRSGGNAVGFFDPASHAAMEARIALDTDLRRALPEQQLLLYYQTQVDHVGRITGAEVLLRWLHPDLGLVPPLQFIPLAEENGMIVPIGRWVLEQACAQIRAWESDPLAGRLTLAVNVSPRQFRQVDFVEQMLAVLDQTAISPGRLKLELTESLVLDNIADTIAKMQALREVGVRFSMDDFGTGYSSLAYLSQLPLDQVKIDQSFVGNIGVKPADQVIVQTIIGMSHNLGLSVIAEGVETEAQLEFLRQNGCPCYQGFLFGRPMPLDEFEALLRARNGAA